MSKRKPQEAVSGSYTPTPHALLDSVAFQGASYRAKALLFELLRQHNGSNNGHLHLATDWLKRRGWKSHDMVQKSKAELQARGLIVKTRTGGLRMGPDRFALTWLNVSNFAGLDIKHFQPGDWRFLDPLPTVKKRNDHPGKRDRLVPPHGTETPAPVPANGTATGDFTVPPVPANGNNECLPVAPSEKRIGKAAHGAWIAAETSRLAQIGLAGRQCFQIPPGRKKSPCH
ncbi:MAG: hypothetical protein KJZ92_04875 [Rhodocyclaceae bacterium]|nr:hypothetical protein [Rhodocyclaceae bacterium]